MKVSSSINPTELVKAAATEFERVVLEVLRQKPRARILLTGGTLGIQFVSQLSKLDLPWSKIWLMFSDERYVPLNDPDRNELQGIKAWPALAQHLTRFPEASGDLGFAAEQMEKKLFLELGPVAEQSALFDITILGMGPDSHVASLFPDHERPGGWIVAEPESPKPPKERLSLSYQALNRSERVWFVASGSAKTWAVKESMRADSGLPASRVRGKLETRWFLDQEITDEL